MAREIFINMSVTANKGYLTLARSANYYCDMAGSHVSLTAQTIHDTATILDIDVDVATTGVTWLRNLDASNVVVIGKTFDEYGVVDALLRLKPGEAQLLRLATNELYAQALSGSVVLEHCVFED